MTNFLAGPADDEEIVAAQSVMGMQFPAEVVESLRCHNGMRGWARLLPETPLSVAAIVEHWEMCMEVAETVDGFRSSEVTGEPWWHALWLPFAGSEGDAMVVDLRPGPDHGRLGWAVHDNGGNFDDAWPTVGDYLAAVADGLTHGGEVKGWQPYMTNTGELWWDLAGAPMLDEPLRPAPTL